MKSRGMRVCLAISLSFMMVISMMPAFAFAAGSAGSVDNDRYRIVAKDGYNSKFSFAEVLIGQPADDDPNEIATPGYAYVGDTYRYALKVDGEEQESGVTWTLTENSGTVSYVSGALDKSVLEFSCIKSGNVTITAYYNGQQVRKADIAVSGNVSSGNCGDNITWELRSDRSLVLSGSGVMYDYEFRSCPWAAYADKILSVSIDSGITHIGAWAFCDCKRVSSVELPSTLKSIGEGSFYRCSGLGSISLPSEISEIEDYTFDSCRSFRQITLPDNVTSIGAYAFRNCEALKVVDMPETVSSIGIAAFKNCDSLTNFTLPAALTELSEKTFRGCNNLRKVVLPEGVTAIGDEAFRNCYTLTSVSMPDSLKTIGESAFENCDKLDNITIGKNVTEIGASAFFDCEGLKSIALQPGLEKIDEYAFEYCTNLINITIPDGVKSIGKYAFRNCKSLVSITIPSSISKINGHTFYRCSSLETVNLPETLTTIESSAFEYCEKLNTINIPATVRTIGRCAFYNCTSLHYVKVPSGVSKIYNYALGYFEDKSGNAKVDDSFVIEGEKGSKAETYADNNGINFIESGTSAVAIADCTIADIADQAYTGSAIVPTLRITDTYGRTLVQGTDYTVSCADNIEAGTATVAITGDGTRYTGEMTKTFKIVSGKTDISTCNVSDIAEQEYTGEAVTPAVEVKAKNGDVLSNGTDYTLSYENNVNSGSSARVIISGAGSYTGELVVTFTIKLPYIAKGFCGKDGKENIEWVLDNDGTLTLSGTGEMENYESSSTPWSDYSSNVKNIVIGDGITTIGAQAFTSLYYAIELSIGTGVTDIGHDAFRYCRNLTSITIPSNVKNIYKNAFSNCYSLKTAELNDGLEAIGMYAFSNCYSLNSVDIPDSVTTIGDGAFQNTAIESVKLPKGITAVKSSTFSNCSKLKTVELPNGITEIGSSAFSGCTSLQRISLPAGLQTIEWDAFYGCTSLQSISLPAGLETIKDCAFSGCTSLQSILLPTGLQTIGNWAFSGCTGLQSIDLPAGLQTIEWNAFYGCTSLSSVSIPDTVNYIYDNAFFGCESLKKVEVPAGTRIYGRALGYYQNTLSGDTAIVDGFVIRGYKGSPAESYAANNGITFDPICSHSFSDLSTFTHVEAVDAGCETAGNIEYYKCSECGRLYAYTDYSWKEISADDVVIAAKGHDWDYSNKIGDTYYKCKNCDATTTADPEIQSRATAGSLTAVPASLTAKTLSGIKGELSSSITSQDGFSGASVAYFDVSVEISRDAGNSWTSATTATMPSDGITCTIKYSEISGLPANMNEETLAKYDFAAAQMSSFTGTAGTVTVPACTKTSEGIEITVHSSGPLAIGFKETPKYKISGKISGYSGDEEITVSISESGDLSNPETVTAANGKYSVSGLEAGTYYIEATASGCIAKSYTVELSEDTTQDVEIYHIGDADMNGKVNADDVTVIARHIAKIEVCDDAFALQLFDTDSSARVSADDVTHLARYLARIIDTL